MTDLDDVQSNARLVGSDKYQVFNLHQQSSHQIESVRGELESEWVTLSANKSEAQIEWTNDNQLMICAENYKLHTCLFKQGVIKTLSWTRF